MKKILLTMACLLTLTATAQRMLSNSEVDRQWRSKTIAVKDGGAAPDVVTLLRAFDKVMHTWVVGQVLTQLEHPAKGTKRDGTTLLYEDHDNDEFRILIDPRNGFVEYSSETDVDQMSCCVWRRTNGHRIFAISLYEQHDYVTNLLCWYDYDPATQTMKAEQSPIDKYKKAFQRMDIGWTLPRKGTDFLIHEYHFFPDIDITQVYGWDGMELRHKKTQMSDFKYQLFGEGDWLQASKQGFTQYALVDIDNSGSPVICLKKSDTDWLVVDEFRGKMQTVTVCDEATRLESIYHVVPEAGKPWTEKDVVVYTSDFEHVHYYVVMQDGRIGYIVTSEPSYDEEQGGVTEYSAHKNGYGAEDESIDIIHADRGDDVFIKPQWQAFEFVKN